MTERLTSYESRQARGLGWQDHGPVLRNRSPRSPVGSRFIGALEAVIWITTRDMDSIRGALGYVSAGEDRSLPPSPGPFALVVLDGTLPRDVAGHHLDCAVLADRGACMCDSLGRTRYCRCPDRAVSQPYTCTCVKDAKAALVDAIHDGMQIFGRFAAGDKPVDLHKDDPTALIDMQFHADGSGLRLIPSYAEELLSWADLLVRWPADLSDQPNAVEVVAAPVAGEPEAGRPTLQNEALSIFAQRLRRGVTKWPAAVEADSIAKAASRAKNKDSITKWLRPYYRRVFNAKRLDPVTAAAVAGEIEADLETARRLRVLAAQKVG